MSLPFHNLSRCRRAPMRCGAIVGLGLILLTVLIPLWHSAAWPWAESGLCAAGASSTTAWRTAPEHHGVFHDAAHCAVCQASRLARSILASIAPSISADMVVVAVPTALATPFISDRPQWRLSRGPPISSLV